MSLGGALDGNIVGWAIAQITTGISLFVILRYLLRAEVKREVSRQFTTELSDKVTLAVNNAVASQAGDIKAYIIDVHELIQRTVVVQDSLVAATEAVTKLGERFETLYDVCPFGKGDGCKLPNSSDPV